MLIFQGVSPFSSALEFDDVNALGTCNTKTTSLVKLPFQAGQEDAIGCPAGWGMGMFYYRISK